MRIFMLCNVELPLISELKGVQPCIFGGWLDDISKQLIKNNDLTVCYMDNINSRLTEGNNHYIGFAETDAKEVLSSVISENNFDVYHIWGTEYEHSYICVSLLDEINLLDRCIVSIQGLVSVYARHYAEGIPYRYFKRKWIRDFIFGNQIVNGIKEFKNKGIHEVALLKKVKHVIGRTSWDRACLDAINKNAIYYKCNENLRSCFYDDTVRWEENNVNKHSIFVSQCSYPVKGLHYLLEAMPMILEKFPDAKIVTTGIDFVNRKVWKRILLGSYNRYLLKLIGTLNLYDKIEFKGHLTAEQMRDEYLTANVFVCCSTIENSSNSVGEAMMIGCPVVASYVGGTMDMIKHNEEGYLYQTSSPEMLAHYVCKVFENKENTMKISLNARVRARLIHDIAKNNGNMISIYEEVSKTSM